MPEPRTRSLISPRQGGQGRDIHWGLGPGSIPLSPSSAAGYPRNPSATCSPYLSYCGNNPHLKGHRVKRKQLLHSSQKHLTHPLRFRCLLLLSPFRILTPAGQWLLDTPQPTKVLPAPRRAHPAHEHPALPFWEACAWQSLAAAGAGRGPMREGVRWLNPGDACLPAAP